MANNTTLTLCNWTSIDSPDPIPAIVCLGLPSLGVVILLCLLICCCCCCCAYHRRRRKRRGSRTRQSGLEGQEQSSSIDLATGQISGEQEQTVESNLSSVSVEKKKAKTKCFAKDTPKNRSDNQSRKLPTKSNEEATNTSTSPPPTMQSPSSNTYKKLRIEAKNDIDADDPNYDTIETVLEHGQESGEHRYHVLCGPDNPQHNKSKAGNNSPDYDEVIGSGVASKNTATEHKYNVLDSGIELNPIQKGIIQEDKKSSKEDKYYSTAREHRLVAMKRRFSQNDNGNHMYEAVSQEGNSQSGDNGYDQIQLRHNTFTSQTNLEKKKRAVIRSHSATGRTVEKLDPMYDEPIVSDPAKNINSNSLFDDPIYLCNDDCGRGGPSGKQGAKSHN